jgi:uncharacterized membrane protein YwzB
VTDLLYAAVVASLIGAAAPLGIGWIWDGGLRRRGMTAPSLGMVYWLGLMSVGTFVLFAYALQLPQGLVVAFVPTASLAGWLLHLARRTRSTVPGFRALTPFLPLVLVGIVYCVLDPVRGWDSYLNWFAKVRLMDQWIPLSRFQELDIIRPEYPFLGPAAWWWTQTVGKVPVEAARVVYLFAYVAFFMAALTHYSARWKVGGRVLAVFYGYTCFTLEIINGYQDGLLMASAGMVALAFLQWGDRGVAWIAPMAATLSLIKSEGTVVGALLFVCWFASDPRRFARMYRERTERRRLLIAMLGFVIVCSAWPWLEWRSGLNPGRVHGDAFRIVSVKVFAEQAERVPTIVAKLASDLAAAPWVSVPFAAAALSAAFSRALDRRRRFLIGFVVLHVLFVVVVFWATQLPFEYHLAVAGARLLAQGRLVMVLFVFETAVQQWAPIAAAGQVPTVPAESPQGLA